MIFRTLSTAALLVLFFASCTKGSDPLPGKTPSEILKGGHWKLVEAYSNTSKDGVNETKDVYAQLQDCKKDNVIIFDNESKLTLDEGATKCSEFDPQTKVNETWVLVSNDRIEFTNVIFESKYEASIVRLSETVLFLRTTGTQNDGTYFENSFKYEKVN
jgi:hypothetical protein